MALSLVVVFVSKNIVSDISIATPAFMFVSICMEYLSPSPHFQSMVFSSEVSLLLAAYT